MKTLAQNHNEPTVQSLFQVASRIDDFTPTITRKSAPPINTPFADLMLHPEKLEAALNAAKVENDTFAMSHKARTKRATRSAAPKNRNSNGIGKSSNRSLVELKTTEFHLESPFAESVKLAADFTDWEQFPLDMVKSEDGVWYTAVPLPPGHYSYRFIVDGEWCDDPHPAQLVPNPFGTANAVVEVT